MKIRYVVLGALAAVSLAGAAAAAETTLKASMTGANETPPADPKGSGTATVKVSDSGQVCWHLMTKDLASPIAAHIHKGAKGVSGPPVVPLTPPDAKGMSEGCANASADVAKDLVAHPEDYYVNVHTTAFKGGAIRGQLGK
jgi:hypothetical protein